MGRDLVGGEMLPAPGQEFLFGRLGPWRHDNEGDRPLFLASFSGWRDACVGDHLLPERDPAWKHFLAEIDRFLPGSR